MKKDISTAQQMLIRDLDLEPPGKSFSKIEQLHAWLTVEVAILIDRDFQRLLNVMYRIDVRESLVKAAFAGSNPASDVARLMIERELQKVETRKKYRD